MSEIRIFYREDNRLKLSKDIDVLKRAPRENLLWIDLNDVTEEAESRLEQFLKIYIQEEEEMEEIEISSRYMETENSLVANSRFLLSNFEEETVSFIIKDNTLVSVRSQELPSFNDTMRKLFASPRSYPTGYHVLTTLLETRVDYDADLIEDLTREITELSSHLKSEEDVDNAILIAIKELQERTMIIRENIVDKQRVCSNMIKSILIPADAKAKMSILIKDINSLFEHLVNIQQNKIIKIFTIVSVVFMPPTLVASIYGMNFKVMPELEWKYGYPFAILLMICGVIGILWYFKRKKWF